MRRSRAAALLVVGLATHHLLHLVVGGGSAAWLWVLSWVAFVVSVPVAIALWRSRGLQCRVCAILLALGSALMHVLAATIGPPGELPQGWTAESEVVVALAFGVVLLLVQQTLLLVRANRVGDPYA